MTLVNEKALLANASNCQADALNLLADEAEDRGNEELALGYRWLALNEKWPMSRRLRKGEDGFGSGYWYWTRQGHEFFADSYELPEKAFSVPNNNSEWADLPTCLRWAAGRIGWWLK